MNTPSPAVHIVEDDPSVRRALSRLLRSLGLRSVTFSTAEALLADERHSDAGCFLLDVHLIEMTGFELADCLKAEGSTVPVILITGHLAETTEEEAKARGVVALLAKPFTEDALIDALRRALGEAPWR